MCQSGTCQWSIRMLPARISGPVNERESVQIFHGTRRFTQSIMRTSDCILLAVVVLCALWLELAAASPVLGYEPMERDDNETAGSIMSGMEEATPFFMSMDKRVMQPRGPLDDCKSYFECKSRFIKYLDGLARMGKMGR
ncbi:hypothetical protein BV898_03103 [Hypsibius exemplaris]|uniref:Uncharacterized protein n=1 Tax=Hypsibius exemplaris TaxID=2072580 RepID=A0A1W0X6D9_HYPEX|nr:hypothetical protein BV898_03103 [Hypsibius exemplaris]